MMIQDTETQPLDYSLPRLVNAHSVSTSSTDSVKKPWQCQICGVNYERFVFFQKHLLRQHGIVFDAKNEKPHIKDPEPVVQIQPLNLSLKMKPDVGRKKRYLCTTCGLDCITSKALSNHRRKHADYRQHICPHCPTAFKRSDHLTEHITTIHQKIILKCRCGKELACKSSLRLHKKVCQCFTPPSSIGDSSGSPSSSEFEYLQSQN